MALRHGFFAPFAEGCRKMGNVSSIELLPGTAQFKFRLVAEKPPRERFPSKRAGNLLVETGQAAVAETAGRLERSQAQIIIRPVGLRVELRKENRSLFCKVVEDFW